MDPLQKMLRCCDEILQSRNWQRNWNEELYGSVIQVVEAELDWTLALHSIWKQEKPHPSQGGAS